MVCSAKLGLALVSAASFALADHVVPYLQQSFFFDWNPVTQPVPVPTTAQCEVLPIEWSRAAATGPNPTAPYYLQIYTSTFTSLFIIPAGPDLAFNFTVPWVPTTQYQICMFDTYGNTGGCEAVYTVYPAQETSTDVTPTCANVTYPTATLDVNGTVSNGPLSRYGWIDQCTDLTLTPKSGTPPFTMTIAPALHPPFNITSHTMDPITWTVSLSYASPFFVSLVDSTGLTWANGPLHSGGGGSTECLDMSSSTNTKVGVPVVVGGAIGGLVLGTSLGVLAAALFTRHKYKSLNPSSQTSSLDITGSHSPHAMSNRPHGISAQYEIEPFGLHNDPQRSAPASLPTAGSDTQSDPSSGQQQQRSHVYVVHHDAGRAPVTVYADSGANIVELPPTYVGQDSASGSIVPQRRPGPAPRKGSNPSDRAP